MILDTFLIYICLQQRVGGLPRHGIDYGYIDPALIVPHCLLAAAGELLYSILDYPYGLAGLIDLIYSWHGYHVQ